MMIEVASTHVYYPLTLSTTSRLRLIPYRFKLNKSST